MSKLTYTISEKEASLKMKKYLKDILKLSTRFVRGAAYDGRIKVNNKVVKLNHILSLGDIVELTLDRNEEQNIQPEKMEISVIYEDEDLIVVNKPPYMVVHPTKSYPLGTLSNGLLYYFREKGEGCIVRLVSRLDMNTSGLVLIAKNQFSHMALARDLHDSNSFEKSYIAVAHGHLKEEKGTIDLPIYRETEDSMKRIVDERGQRSITHYQVLEKYEAGELVKLTLETGRTHQIRVHLSYLGNAIFGDTLYGTENDGEYISRQALHAYRLVFPHPRTRDIISLEAPVPDDMEKLKLILKK